MLDARANDRLGRTRFGPVRWFDELPSTNTFLLAEAGDGALEGAVVVAEHQTAGRGRLGRTWTAPAGSALLCSVLFRPDFLPPGHAHLLTAIMGLAAADGCAAVAGFVPDLKWPNDLVVEESGATRKLAGILAESDLGADGRGAVVVGLGLNVNWPESPPGLEQIAVATNQVAGAAIDRDDLLVAILEALDRRYAALAEPGGPAMAVTEYRARCSTIGRRVRVEMVDSQFTGRAVDLSDTGQLGVAEDGGSLRWISAGDVTHLRLR